MHTASVLTESRNELSVGEHLLVLLTGWMAAIVLLAGAGFWLGIPITPWHAWAAWLMALAGTYAAGARWRTRLIAMAAGSALIVMAVQLAGRIHDLSFDGQVYHMPAVIALAEGWNPMQQTTLAQWNPEFAEAAAAGIYVEHYAKGAWFLAAAIYKLTGNIESGKAIGLILLIMAFLAAWSVLRRMEIRGKWALTIAAAAALNPVALYQATTFYVDGQLASLFTLCLFLSIDYLRAPRRWVLALLVCSFLLLIEVKFTGLVYAVLLGLGFAIGAWLAGKRHAAIRYALSLFCVGVIAVGILGYQPYITNTINYGHPFYPAVGQAGDRNIQWKQAAPEFIAMNRFAKLGLSVFSKTSNTDREWKIPMTVNKSELLALTSADTRYAGLGPLYSGVVTLALILALLTVKDLPRTELKANVFVIVLLAVTILINPESWWARLSPQLWLLPVIPIVATVRSNIDWKHWIAAITISLMLANSLLISLINMKHSVERSNAFSIFLTNLNTAEQVKPNSIILTNGFSVTTDMRLKEYGIRYVNTETLNCVTNHEFSHILKICKK